MKIVFASLVLLLVACNSANLKKNVAEDVSTNISSQKLIANADSDTEIIEIFTDSLSIGRKGKSKIELIKHRVLDRNYVIVNFYTKSAKSWYIQNTYVYESTALMDLQPEMTDFNNDTFNDITFISGTAARGGNEVRRLFIYDDKQQALRSIINSEDYPNMLYNAELDCVDAFLLHGGSSTIFARIVGDSLKQFASVHRDSHLTVYEIDAAGKEILLQRDSISDFDDTYIRYSNYKPLKE